MKTISAYTTLRAGLLFLLVSAASSAATVHDPLALKVQVNVPASWNLIVTDRIGDDFVDGLRELLSRRGFHHEVEPLGYVDSAERVPYLLTINLVEWRMQRTGLIDCTLTASLNTPRGTRDLGLYTYSSLHLPGSGRYLLNREFDEAASGALNKLVDELVRSEMLPDLREHAA